MALAAGTHWSLNASATASNVNGGGFNTGNANFITDFAATVATSAAPVVTSATYTFVAGDVDAWLYVKSGTNWTAGFYKIASVAGGAATLNAAVGAAVQLSSATGIWGPSTVAGCATVASPTGGTCGIDFSQGTAAIINGTDLACADGDVAGAVVTSAGTPFSNRYIGNLMKVTAGVGYTVDWYEIVSVSGSSATLDKAVGTDGSKTNGTFYVGGSLSLGHTTDDAVFEKGIAGNHWWMKAGTYALGGTVDIATGVGTRADHIVVQGFSTVRGETLAVASYPVINCGATVFSTGSFWKLRYLSFTGTGNPYCVNLGAFAKMSYCKVRNTGGGLVAIYTSGGSAIYNCDIASTTGTAVKASSYVALVGNYIHDSTTGILMDSGLSISVIGNIVAGCSTCAIDFTGTNDNGSDVYGNTLYGAETPAGIGFRVIATTYRVAFVNNIIYGFTTGMSCASAVTVHYIDHNNWYNNTTDATNLKKGPNDQAVSPAFVAAASQNWAIGAGLKGLGAPAAFIGTNTTSYPDIGAVQRSEAAAVAAVPAGGVAHLGPATF